MIVTRIQNGDAFHTRFNSDTRMTEITLVRLDNGVEPLVLPDPVQLDYHQVDIFSRVLDEMTLTFNEAMDRDVEAGLRAMGIEPTGDEPEVLGYQPGDFVAEAITEYWGRRCPETSDACPCCRAWAQYDKRASALAKPSNGDTD
jgi:hypothetical protein